jgi:signal peptidase I
MPESKPVRRSDSRSESQASAGLSGRGATRPREGGKSTVREYFESIVIAVILALFVRTFVVQAFKIPTGSMENNLLIGDHLLVNKFVFGPAMTGAERAILPMREIERGAIIVFKWPVEPERDFIKRVIGLPGETVEMRNKKMYIDGTPLDEPYVRFLHPPEADGADAEAAGEDVQVSYGPVTVPANHYFVMGDNRDNSQDSRYWGFLPRDYVKGEADMIYWSYDAEAGGGPLTLLTGTRWSRLLRQIH